MNAVAVSDLLDVTTPSLFVSLPIVLTAIFGLWLSRTLVMQPRMFCKRHGRKHALTGLWYLMLLIHGTVDLAAGWHDFETDGAQAHSSASGAARSPLAIPYVVFDTLLGVSGIALTLLAAYEFKHKGIKNFASGTLDKHATVTYAEMIEHAFYQGLNLAQVLFLHFCAPQWSLVRRLFCLFLVTLPWLFRDRFPVHPFSNNYKDVDPHSSPLVRVLYRIKKYQYVFYKHFLLHGLNITVAVVGVSLAHERFFRVYWLLLNMSYVMEFFLQTLVKKEYMSQSTLLALQKLLMLAASLGAIGVLQVVSVPVALASMALNFALRKRDMLNTALVSGAFAAMVVTRGSPQHE